MRISFLIPNINLQAGGGSHLSFHLTASELGRLGHEVRVIALNPSPTALPSLPYRVQEEVGWGGQTRFGRLSSISKVMHRLTPGTDVFHIYSPECALAGGIYRGAGGQVPTVATLYSYTLWCTNVDRMNGRCHQRCGAAQRVLHSSTSPLRRVL